MLIQSIPTSQLALGAVGIVFIGMGGHLLVNPNRFNWWLYNDEYDSESRKSMEQNQEYLRGIVFVLGGVVFLYMALTW